MSAPEPASQIALRQRPGGDKPKVVALYNEYITDVGNAMAYSGEAVDGTYEGEYNAAGQYEGRGTFRYASGNVYEGEYKAGKKDGHGTYHFADGTAAVLWSNADVPVGEGVHWTADRQTAWRLQDGKCVGEAISPEEAQKVAERLGLPVPEPIARL